MIKYLIMDIDGSLTDGKIYVGNHGEMMKAFSVRDGYAINYILKPAEIEPVIITGRSSEIVKNRCIELGIDRCYQGITQKLTVLEEQIGKDNLGICAYFGDDILDLACMIAIKKAGGLVGCPTDAVQEVKTVADYICENKAGEGAMREFSEWLIKSENSSEDLEKRIKEAVQYIVNISTDNLKTGRYEVNNWFYYTVQYYQTGLSEDCRLESHKEYVDIQMILEGEEAIDVANIAELQKTEQYSIENDIAFWKPIRNMMRMVLCAGSYVVLYPRNAHRGGIRVNRTSWVKKIVGKVRVEKL